MKSSILAIFIFSTFAVSAANTDSLRKVYNNPSLNDSLRLKAILSLAWTYIYSNPDSAILISKKELAFHSKLDKGKYDAYAYNTIAVGCMNKGDYPGGLENFLKALEWAEKYAPKNKGNVLMNIGIVYQYQNNIKLALEYFFRSLPLLKGDKQMEGLCYANIANAYGAINQEESSKYFFKAIPIFEKLNDKVSLSSCYTGLGGIAERKNDLSNAIKFYLKALQLKKETGDNYGEGICYLNTSSIYNKMFNYKLAIQYATLGLETAKKLGDLNNLGKANELLALAFAGDKDYKKAYQHQRLFKALYDSLYNIQNDKKLSDLKIQYEIKKKEIEFKTKAEEQINEQKTKRNFYVGGAGLLVLTSFLGFNRQRLKQKNRYQQKLNLQQKQQAIAVMETQEQERKRIAEDIHDSLGHLLSTAKHSLQTLPSPHREHLENSLQLLNQASTEIHNISFNLMPHTLEEEGLVPALNELVSKITNAGAVRIMLHVYGMENLVLEKQVEFNIYRIVQEAVNNILKHAAAAEINVQLIHQNSHLSIMIEDDGKGFDTERKRTGRGLRNIQTRSSWLNGSMTIDSTPGRGTTITTEIPV